MADRRVQCKLGCRWHETAEYEIAPARWPEDTEEARALLTNYGQYLAASPVGAAGLCLAGYEAELRGFTGQVCGERGRSAAGTGRG